MSNEEIISILNCLKSKKIKYKIGEIIFIDSQELKSFGMIIKGEVQVIKEDLIGNKNILVNLYEGQSFGDAPIFSGTNKSEATVIAKTDCEIMLIDGENIISENLKTCDLHLKLLQNIIKSISIKNVILNKKIEVVSKPNIREKLICYLTMESKKNNENNFTIGFSRNELAEYLCSNRSAIHKELCKMRDEGIIDFYRNSFKILK